MPPGARGVTGVVDGKKQHEIRTMFSDMVRDLIQRAYDLGNETGRVGYLWNPEELHEIQTDGRNLVRDCVNAISGLFDAAERQANANAAEAKKAAIRRAAIANRR
jgi:hypothetical protein